MERNSKKQSNDKINKSKITISKTMSYLLRHGAKENNLSIDSRGFVLLNDLLSNRELSKLKVNKEVVYEIVNTNDKKRFEILNENGKEYIRAVQGHTIEEIKNEDALEKIKNIYDFPVIVHGTYQNSWEIIKTDGLNKMKRNCIHFAIGEKNSSEVISGMRQSCDMYIEIDASLCIADGIEMYVSKNLVILSSGVDGIIKPNYFRRVIDRKGNIIKGMNFNQMIYPIISVVDGKIIIKNIIFIEKKEWKIEINIINEILLNSNSDYDLSNLNLLNNFSEQYLKKGFNKYSTVMILNSESNQVLLKDFIGKYQDKVNHIGLYEEYIIVNGIENINNDNLDIVISKLKEVSIEFKEKSNGNEFISAYFTKKNGFKCKYSSDIDDSIKVEKNMNIISKNKETTDIINIMNDSNDYKRSLLDKSISKNYILLFINYEKDNELEVEISSIEYSLILNSDFDKEKIIIFESVHSNLTNKSFIENFLSELKERLIKTGIFNKLIYVCALRDDITYLNRKIKKAGLQSPNIFRNNMIELNKSDFNQINDGQMLKAIHIFEQNYVSNDDKLKKIKLFNS